mmetsp:Transcript_6644/g.24651  ORF Transcript_6644/g.24651 Transcript_6644/m.24651 type:complete len:234 (+) Transcript_6644:61-762(+)
MQSRTMCAASCLTALPAQTCSALKRHCRKIRSQVPPASCCHAKAHKRSTRRVTVQAAAEERSALTFLSRDELGSLLAASTFFLTEQQAQAAELLDSGEMPVGTREALAGFLVLFIRVVVFKAGIEGVKRNVESALAKCKEYGIPTDDLYQQTDPQIFWWMFVEAWKPPRKGDALHTPSVMLGKLKRRISKYEIDLQKGLCLEKGIDVSDLEDTIGPSPKKQLAELQRRLEAAG